MLLVTCIKRIRDRNNNIIAYTLQDKDNNITTVTSCKLKQAIKIGRINVNNLTLTSDNKLKLSKVNPNNYIKRNDVFEITYEMISDISNSYNLSFKTLSDKQQVDRFINKAKIIGLEVKTLDKEKEVYAVIKNNNKDYCIVSSKKYYIKNGKELFQDTLFKSIDLRGVDTSLVTDMSCMFNRCEKLQELNISKLDTHNVVSMDKMFSGCEKLRKLDVSNFDTHKVVNMHRMFSELIKAEITGIENLNTSNVTNTSRMFFRCNINYLDISNFDTSKVTNMSAMFKECTVSKLRLCNLDTSEVTNMSEMFNCFSIKDRKLDLSMFNTANVTNMSKMFYGCELESLNISEFNTSKVTNMEEMFAHFKCKELDLSSFDITNVIKNSKMFYESETEIKWYKQQ